MKHVKQRLLSLLLVFAMLCSLSLTALAAEEDGSETGTGTGSSETGGTGTGQPSGDDTTHTCVWESTPFETKEATCTKDGYKKYKCTVAGCDKVDTRDEPALGHDYESEITKAPTCKDEGVLTQTCKRTGCGDITTTPIKKIEHTWDKGKITTPATCAAKGTTTYTCTVCGETEVRQDIPITEDHVWGNAGKCTICGKVQTVEIESIKLNRTSETILVNDTFTLTATVKPDSLANAVRWSSSNENVATVTDAGRVKGIKAGTATITATVGSETATCKVTVVNETGLQLSLSKSKPTGTSTDLSYNSSESARTFSVNATGTYNGSSSGVSLSYDWSLRTSSSTNAKEIDSSSSSRYSSFTVDRNDIDDYSSLYLECTVTAHYSGVKSVEKSVGWTIYNDDRDSSGDIEYSAKAGANVDFDRDDFEDWWEKSYKRGTLDYVEFTSTSSGSLYADYSNSKGTNVVSSRNPESCYARPSRSQIGIDALTFVPSSSSKSSVTIKFTAYGTTSSDSSRNSSKSGTVVINYSGTSSSSGDIEYSAKAGADVDFDRDDFEDWWEDSYNRYAELDYVEFTSASSGTLYADYSGSKGTNVVSSRSPESCYARPSRSQIGIDDLTFVPSSNSTSNVTIKFTAYGTTSSSSTRNTSKSGTVVIKYSGTSSSTAKDITYSTTGTKGVNLSASDFTSRYKDVIGSSASTLTIRFTSVPSSGTLTYEPSSGRDVTLTSSNIKNYDFSSSSSGTYRISNVVYTPNSNTNITSDKVKYDCYTGNTLRFSGTIVFSSTATSTVVNNVTISYSTTGSSIAFNAADFYNKNSAMLSASYLTFGTPSSGTLYAGSAVATTGTKYSYVANNTYQHIGNLSYRPAANFNGTATISFTAYNSNGTQAATGTVNILVATQTVTPTTPTTPATPSAPSNTNKTFSDVPNTASTSWYYNEVTTLAAAGIVAGRNDGKFYPKDNVNYGEALKLILLAAGYPQQTELSGAVWANNYLNLAITNGILSGSASDYTLSKAIDRDHVGEMAAKALKLTPVTGGTSPYADTNNGYILALTNAGIVQGDSSSGTTRWRGSDTLTRAEVSKIVYNVYKYRNVSPGSTAASTPTIDTNKPGWLN